MGSPLATTLQSVACDLARAFIKRDASLFKNTSVRPYAGKGPKDYAKFLKTTIDSLKKEPAKTQPLPDEPKLIEKVFAARHLTMNGPASYGYAAFNFQDIMFVDVRVLLHDDRQSLRRTLVIKDNDGKWYAHPLPTARSGMLAAGLNDESPSVKDFADVYEFQK